MNLKFPLIQISGKPYQNDDGSEVIAGKLLAEQLAKSNLPDFIKWNDIAMKLYKCEEVTLDKSDTDKLKKFIESSNLTNWVKGQLIENL